MRENNSKLADVLTTKERRKQLGWINLHAMLSFSNDLSPRGIWSISAALIVLLIVGFIDGFGLLFLLLPCVAFVACYLFCRAPLSWGEVLEADLADYEPLDIEAFQFLQANVASFGLINKDAFHRWFSSELIALDSEEGAAKKSPKHRFLSRRFSRK